MISDLAIFLNYPLQSQGLVDLDDILSSPDSVDDKDILKELLKSQTELKNISADNKNELMRLIQRARQQIKLKEMEEQLQAIDTEVVEAYRRLHLVRSRQNHDPSVSISMLIVSLYCLIRLKSRNEF